ncbi:hypothetical protein C8R46DRAFT_839640, partial [Mycena filopes]
TCTACHERWFDLEVKDGKCEKCRKSGRTRTKFQDVNDMNPGAIPGPDVLPPLTQIEEMIISPVHALVSLYQIRDEQFKYSGHCSNFARDTAVVHNKVPLLAEECDVIIMRRTGVDAANQEDIHQDFRVRRHVIQKWLVHLEAHHPTFRSRRVTIDWARLNELPEDASVRDRLRTVESQAVPGGEQDDAGPPEEGGPEQPQDPLFTRGFVPNVANGQTEIEQLHAAAFHDDNPVILTMPAVHGTPINEHAGRSIAIDAFPSLFPNGQADFAAHREMKVTMTEWAAHLMRFEDGRFARGP